MSLLPVPRMPATCQVSTSTASSRVFYPTDPVYGDSAELQRAIDAFQSKGFQVRGEVIPVSALA